MAKGRRHNALLPGIAAIGMVYWLVRYFSPRHSVAVLNGKVTLITLADSWMGRELAMSFARQGARIVLAGSDLERLEAVRREVEPYASEVLVIQTDFADDGQLKKLIQAVITAFGRIDVLVNNADLAYTWMLSGQGDESVNPLIDINLKSVIRLTQEVRPIMLAQRSVGYIVNVGTAEVQGPPELTGSRVAIKSGLAAFSDSLRHELRHTDIQVMLALPVLSYDATTLPGDGERETGIRFLEAPTRHPEQIADHIVESLVQGKRDLIMGGFPARLSLFMERHFPLALSLFRSLLEDE